tara:strand:- start:33 stop:269 length:237 start_codon:yes stop_codon:yes gene_type:complete
MGSYRPPVEFHDVADGITFQEGPDTFCSGALIVRGTGVAIVTLAARVYNFHPADTFVGITKCCFAGADLSKIADAFIV